MPRVSGKKSYSGRRYSPYAKRRKTASYARATNVTRNLSVPRGIVGFPSSLQTKLRYHEGMTFASAAGVVSQNVFRANSLFDPNETGTGHQPMFFDQFAQVYARYVVKRSTIKVTFNPVTETASTSMWMIGIIGQSSGTISADPNVNCEQAHSKWAAINGRDGGPNQKTLTMTFTPESCLNLTSKDTDTGALCNANPDQTYKFVVWTADRQATGTTNLVGEIEILFDVEFSDTIYNAGS